MKPAPPPIGHNVFVAAPEQRPPFNGDANIRTRIQQLVQRFEIQVAVETGTHRGDTTSFFSEVVPKVKTIEIDIDLAKAAQIRFRDVPSVEVYCGSSAVCLPAVLAHINEPTLFYLDAHWRTEWPLLAELDAIAKSQVPFALIAIHDFKVPGLGFDSYGGIDLDFDYVQRGIREIFLDGFCFEQNNPKTASGARRGIGYFYGARRL